MWHTNYVLTVSLMIWDTFYLMSLDLWTLSKRKSLIRANNFCSSLLHHILHIIMALKSTLKQIRPLLVAARSYSSANSLINVAINDKTGIATITMNRKPVNGLNYELLKELNKALEDIDGAAKGAILTSSLPTIFSGGLDIMEMYKPKKERATAFWTELQNTWMALVSTPYPTVAVINGHSPAGGCLFAMSCEYRVMVDKYTIGLNETKLGMVAPFWFISTMRNTIGTRESELALTSGRLYSTQEALKVGLVDEMAANKDEALAKAELFFKNFAKINPVARQMTKTLLRDKMIDELREKQEEDLERFVTNIFDPKLQEALGKYLQSLKK